MSYIAPSQLGRRLTGDIHQLAATMPPFQRLRCASDLDRESDHALHLGHADRAERCSERAAALRATCLTPEHLAPQDEHRFRAGWEAVAALGLRAQSLFLLQVIQERRDLSGTLDLLDQWRTRLTPEMVRVVGGHRMPRRSVREVA